MKNKKLISTLFFLTFMVFVVELASWLGLKAIDIILPETQIIPRTAQIYAKQSIAVDRLLNSERGGKQSIVMLDPDLGWRYREGFRSDQNIMNQQGLRSERNYSRIVDRRATRIAVFGDSFAFGSEVSNSEAWSTQVEELFPGFEVLNYAVPGFGTDQAYLRYRREGNLLAPKIVIIGFAPVNLRRAVNVYRRFISTREIPLVKPRFILNGQGDLELLPVPYKQASDYDRLLENPQLIKELGRHDQWYSSAVYDNPLYDWSATIRLLTNIWITLDRKLLDPDRLLVGDVLGDQVFNAESSAFRIQSKILEKFYSDVIEAGSVPVIMFFPKDDDILRARNGNPTTYQPLIEFLDSQNMKYIDCVDAFTGLPEAFKIDRLFAPGGHYSAEGNRMIAEFAGKRISALKDSL